MKTIGQSQKRCADLIPVQTQAGFTLIELMISITISLLILAALSAAYVNLARNNNELAKTNIQIENGRSAIQFLQGDIAHGGFWGSYVPQFENLSLKSVPTDVPASVPDPCLEYTLGNWTPAYKNSLLGIAVQSYEAVPSACSGLLTDQQANTDILVVRHAETCVPGENNCEPDVAGKLYFQSALCAAEAASPYVLDTAGFTRTKKNCLTASDKRKFISNIYYIRNFSMTPGDGIPTLMRSQFDLSSAGVLAHQAPIPLIEGIEAFRVEFGIDDKSDAGSQVNYNNPIAWDDPERLINPTNRGDGMPDGAFVRCTAGAPCTAAQLMNVVAVKLHVLARARESTPGYTDPKTSYALGSTTWVPGDTRFKRHVFSTSVRLHNPSGRRETP